MQKTLGMATIVRHAQRKTFHFSLRWYDPDQVQRVNLSLLYVDTPKVEANIE